MADNPVKVTITADQSEADAAIDLSVAKMQKMAKELDVFNVQAVKAFFEQAEAVKGFNKELGASIEQLDKLDAVTKGVADKADAAGTRMANAFERGARGMSVMARQGDVTARSLNQVIAAGADIAFAFGPEGAIVSGILMVTAGIIAHLESTEQKMVELVDKFNQSLDDMVANSSPLEIAHRAAAAYISELQAQAKLIRDEQLGTWKAIIVDGNSDALFAKFRTHGEREQIDTKSTEKNAADAAQVVVASIDGSEKALETLKKERERLNGDIASSEEHLRGLDKEKNEHEVAETEARLHAARTKLADTETLTRQLEADRAARVAENRTRATLSGDGALEASIDDRAHRFTTADFDAEHSQREENVALSSRGGTGHKQDEADAKRQRDRDAALEREARGQEMLQELEDQISQRHLRALGLRESADIMSAQREFALTAARINNMKVSEQMKTDLLVAAQKDRDEKMADVLAKSAEDAVKGAIKALDHQLKEEEKARKARERIIEGVEKNLAHALVAHHKDMGREILRALLDPEVKHLEGLAAKQFATSAADAAIGNWGGAAEHAAAGAAYMAGATLVASIGGGAGGGAGGSSNGAGNSAATGLGANGVTSSQQIIKLEIVNVTKDQNGREIARTKQQLQRLDDLNMPIRVTI